MGSRRRVQGDYARADRAGAAHDNVRDASDLLHHRAWLFSPKAMLLVPLVGAFFIDLLNAGTIQFFLGILRSCLGGRDPDRASRSRVS